jgi:hypothetical protein
MIRYLKVLILAAFAVAALSAISATGAQAAEGDIHCNTKPCRLTLLPDGTKTTAHQVFIVEQTNGGVTSSVATTCNTLSGHATITEESVREATLTELVYSTCNVSGGASEVRMNGCTYTIKSTNSEKGDTASVQVLCPEGKKIEILVPATGCLISVGPQGPLNQITFHDAETEGIKKQILTAEPVVNGLAATVNAKCPGGLVAGAATGKYTTGNIEITGETDPGNEMKNVWFE